MMKVVQPVRHNAYTMIEVLTVLELPDSPFFRFRHDELGGVLQTSHVTNEQLLSDPVLAATLWSYSHTTSEWCPIFNYSAENKLPIDQVIDIAESRDPHFREWWATPKMWPREQETWQEALTT